jgi:hypothetical protein
VAAWDLALGDEDTRTGIQARHGGSASRGISAPAASSGSRNIMLWWTVERGELYGYVDGWTETGDAFYFSGTGQEGDQHFDAPYTENRRLRDHVSTGDSVRLLRYVAKNKVVYVGELRVDPADPWRWRDGYDRNGNPRRVIQFRLLPVGPTKRLADDPVRPAYQPTVAPEPLPEVPPAPVATDVEALGKEAFMRLGQAQRLVARRVEVRLIHDFRHWLTREHALDATGLRIPYGAETTSLRADLFITAPQVLVEAKASTARENVRMAIGQLLDYRRWITPIPGLCVLTPDRPADDLIELLADVGISAAWRSAPGSRDFVIEPQTLLQRTQATTTVQP